MWCVQPGLLGSNDLWVGRKMVIFQYFFQSREQVVVRRGQIWRIGWVIKTLKAQVGHFLLGCKCPVSRGNCLARTRSTWLPSRGVFHSKYPSIAPAEMSYTPRWYFGPLEDNQWGRCRLDPKKIEARAFPADFCTRNFWGRGEPLCRHSTDCCVVSGS